MDTATILYRLWSSRRALVIVCVLAVLTGIAIMYKVSFPPRSRQYRVGVATDQILIDTPQSQLAQVSPRGTATLSEQTLLLASLMVDGAIKDDIARNAGLRPNQIIGVNNAVTQPSGSGPAPVTPPSGPHAYVLTTQVLTDSAGDGLPIIELTAQAPTRAAAGRLATATITSVRDYLTSVAAEHSVAASNRLAVSDLGVSQSTQTRGPSPILASLAVVLVFALGCGCILAVPVLARSWRAAAAGEQGTEDLGSVLVALSRPQGTFESPRALEDPFGVRSFARRAALPPVPDVPEDDDSEDDSSPRSANGSAVRSVETASDTSDSDTDEDPISTTTPSTKRLRAER